MTATPRLYRDDVKEKAKKEDILLGDNLAGRKEHIAQHGAEYLDDLDVSFYYRGTMKKHFTSKHKAKSFLLRSIEPFNLQRKGFL